MKAAILIALVACSGEGRPEPSQIFRHREHGYSVGQPAGWSTSEDQGATRFAPSSGKQTIVVRSAPRPREIVEGKPTTHADIVEATRAALQRQTRETLAAPVRLDGGELPATQFSFTFQPSITDKRYRRTHVVLVGEQRLYHVIQTAPVAEQLDEQAMREMVTTLAEEG